MNEMELNRLILGLRRFLIEEEPILDDGEKYIGVD